VAARLVDVETGKTFELVTREQNRHTSAHGVTHRFRVNHKASADVPLAKPWISKHHGQILFDEERWWVVDGGSVNTVRVNGERVADCGRRTIRDGDVLGFGETRLRFETDGSGPEPG
jgi:pSer/pThr/pTyr-binding forkhead associated (FHA) protein